MEKAVKKYWPIFLVPTMAAFLIGFIIPFIEGIYLSFCNFTTIKDAKFVGIQNYIEAFKDSNFLGSFKFTTLFAIVSLVLINVLAFLVALALTQNIKGKNIFRTVFFMPNLIGGILLGFTWQFIFVSIFEALGKVTGFTWLQGWLSDQKTGFIGMLIVLTWQLAGYMMIIYIAQLESIPDSYIEAAKIDGATSFQTFIKIKLPLVAPAFTIGLFLSISDSFKMFDQNLALTAGGPGSSTEMIALNIYNTAFKESKLGVAQSKAVVFLIVVVVISLTQLYLSKRKEVEM